MKSHALLHYAHASTRWKLGTLFVLCLWADFLFFPHFGSLTLVLFALPLLVATLLHNAPRLSGRMMLCASILLLGQMAAFTLHANPVSILWVLLGFALLYLYNGGMQREKVTEWLAYTALTPLMAALSFFLTANKLYRCLAHYFRLKRAGAALRHWWLPLLMLVIFVPLLSSANAVLEHWLKQALWQIPTFDFDIERIILWLCVAVIALACIRPRLYGTTHRTGHVVPRNTPMPGMAYLFSPQGLGMALALCNLLFILHITSDAAYLWGNMELPWGISYAQYAQRGTYTLLITALLAAAFVLLAMRSGQNSRWIQALLLLWVGLNILLVGSAIQRLNLYVAAYGLTYMRVAAFIWMALVICGLGLIILRILWHKSETWLILMNLAAVGITLYAVAFANIGGMVAWHNVRHAQQMGGEGAPLHRYYLSDNIGSAALPALMHYREHAQIPMDGRRALDEIIRYMQYELHLRQSDWRNWHLRDYLLLQSLKEQQKAATP